VAAPDRAVAGLGRLVRRGRVSAVRALAQAARRIHRDSDRAALLRRAARGHASLGWCAVCRRRVVFLAVTDWLRDDWRCLRCWSIPRQRALMVVLEHAVPGWRGHRIHESSPGGSSSDAIAAACPGYDASQLWPGRELGSTVDGVRCEDLSRLTLPDASLDVLITQDVLEHVLEPERAFAEVARVLRPGGAHVFTVPWYWWRPTRVRARVVDDAVRHLEPPDFHANPIDPEGSLVATEWGADLREVIRAHGGLETSVHVIRDRRLGIDGDFRDVFVSRRR